MKKRYIVLLFVSFTLFSGCLASKPAIVSENLIKNSSVGYSGYELTIPDGFSVVDHKSTNANDSELTLYHKRELKGFAMEFEDPKEYHFSESFLLTNGKDDISISFSVAEMYMPTGVKAISHIPDDMQDFIMKGFIGELSLSVNKLELKKAKIKKHHAVYVHGTDDFKAKGGNMETANVNIIFILGELDEMYFITGISSVEKQEELNQLMEYITQNIKI